MRWKYYTPYTWEVENRRLLFADFWLLPDKLSHKGMFLWLTIHAKGDNRRKEYRIGNKCFYWRSIKKLGNRNFWIDKHSKDMIVKTKNFNRAELLRWVKVMLRELGFKVSGLVKAPFTDFENMTEQTKAACKFIRRRYEINDAKKLL